MSRLVIDAKAVRDSETLLKEGMALAKCRQCQCMKDALENVSITLRSQMMGDFADVREKADGWLLLLEPAAYE
jgi:hypothetical protein